MHKDSLTKARRGISKLADDDDGRDSTSSIANSDSSSSLSSMLEHQTALEAIQSGEGIAGRPLYSLAHKQDATEREARAVIDRIDDIDAKDLNGATALHHAVVSGNTVVAEALIKGAAANVNIPDKDGNTPLHYAAISKNEALQVLLVTAGANVAVQNTEHQTPLDLDSTIVNIKDPKNNRSILHTKVAKEKIEEVEELLKHGANKGARDNDGNTPFTLAMNADKPNNQIIQALASEDLARASQGWRQGVASSSQSHSVRTSASSAQTRGSSNDRTSNRTSTKPSR